MLADADQAADATQETFFQLVKKADEVTGSIPGWLHRVAVAKAVDLIRSDARRRRREQVYADAQSVPDATWREISPYVDETLGNLDDRTRAVLIGHFLEGRSMTALAEQIFGEDAGGPESDDSVELVDFDPDGEIKMVAAMLYPHSSKLEASIEARVRRMSTDERLAVINAYVGTRANRRQRPGRAGPTHIHPQQAVAGRQHLGDKPPDMLGVHAAVQPVDRDHASL